MKRTHRIAVEVLGPPLIAATILEIVAVVGMREVGTLKLIPFFMVFGYVLAALPSLAFAAILELAFAKGLEPRSWQTVLLSASLGAVSGLPIDMLIARRLTVRSNALCFVLLGAVTGSAIGLLIRTWSRAATPHAPGPGPR